MLELEERSRPTCLPTPDDPLVMVAAELRHVSVDLDAWCVRANPPMEVLDAARAVRVALQRLADLQVAGARSDRRWCHTS